MVGLKPFLGVVWGFGAPFMEDLMVLGLAETKQSRWDQVDYPFGVIVVHDSSEDNDECNGCRCYIWHTDG